MHEVFSASWAGLGPQRLGLCCAVKWSHMVPLSFILCLSSVTSFSLKGSSPSPSEVPGLFWEAHTEAQTCSSAGGMMGYPAWPLPWPHYPCHPLGPMGAIRPTRHPKVQPQSHRSCQGPTSLEGAFFLPESRTGNHKHSPSAQGHPEHSHLVVQEGPLLLCRPLVLKAPGALEGQRSQCPL